MNTKKNIFIFFMLCLALISRGQQLLPDTLYAVPVDTNWQLVSKYNTNTATVVSTEPSETGVYSGAQALEKLLPYIYQNEQQFAASLRALKELERSQRVYQDVNQAINAVSGGNYFTILRQQPNIQQRYVGFYRINYAGNIKYVEFRTNGAAREVNAQGQPVQGGLAGSWQPLSDNSFYLNNFLPVENLPQNTRIIAELDGGNAWFADGAQVRLVKAQQ